MRHGLVAQNRGQQPTTGELTVPQTSGAKFRPTSTALQLPHWTHLAVTVQKPQQPQGDPLTEGVPMPIITTWTTQSPAQWTLCHFQPFPRSSAGKRLYLIHPLSFVWPCLTMTTSRFFQPDGEVLQPSKGLAVVAGCSGNSVGQPDFRLRLITGGEGDSSIRNKIPYTVHTPSLSQQAGRMAKQKENRGKRLLPASELQHYTCYYFQHCYSYFLQRFVIMTSRLHVKAWFTVHFSLAKSAKQSRTASAALRCFYLC